MKTFINVAQMRLATLTAGQFVETGGYYTKGDAGQAKYLIVAAQTADGYGDHTLANGTVAVLQFSNGEINLNQMGIIDDGSDQSVIMQAVFDYCQSNNIKNIVFSTNVLLNNRVNYSGVADLNINLNGYELKVNNSQTTDPYLAAGFYMNGGVGTANLTIFNGKYSGDNSFSVLVSSAILYKQDGWAVGGYATRTVDTLNYTTNRGACVIYDIKAVDSLGMVCFLTNTPAKISNVTTKDVTNTSNNGVFNVRFTDEVIYENCMVENWTGKAYNTSYVKAVNYFNLHTKEKNTDTTSDLSFYFGHFVGLCIGTKLIEHGQADGQLFGSCGKVSYWAEEVYINECVVNSKNQGWFLQGVQRCDITNLRGICTKDAINCGSHTTHGQIDNTTINLNDINVDGGSMADSTYMYDFDQVDTDPVTLIQAELYVNNLFTTGRVLYSSVNQRQGSNLTIIDDGVGDSGAGQAVKVDNMLDYWYGDVYLDCSGLTGGSAIYFNGRDVDTTIGLTVGGKAYPAIQFHSQVSTFQNIDFNYVGKIDNLTTDTYELVGSGLDFPGVMDVKQSISEQVGTARPDLMGYGVQSFYDGNIGKIIYNDYINASGWVDALGTSV